MEQAQVPEGRFAMGDARGDGNGRDGETPVHTIELPAFNIDATTVTVDDFDAFVEATGYVTEAESFGFSAVFHLALAAEPADVLGRAPGTPWWLGVRGADWRHPDGPRSDLSGRRDHPVVHVSWNDAQAYCVWAGRRLPTEAEWERASRAELGGARYPWGDQVRDADGGWRCNIWQGSFPTVNDGEDGWLTTAPVRSYLPNGFGLWQTVGNVWEWCEERFDRSAHRGPAPSLPGRVPSPVTPRVLRGGSYLCHDSSMGNAGFRTVAR